MVKERRKRVFFDMDGTLVNPFDIPNYVTHMYEDPTFFYELPEYSNMVKAMLLFVEKYHGTNIESSILSAANTNPGCKPGKDYWLDRRIPLKARKKIKRIYTNVGIEKAKFIEGGIGPDDYLIDDFSENLIDWENRGGKGIKAINHINGSGRKWNSSTIDIQAPPEDIVLQIEKIIFE